MKKIKTILTIVLIMVILFASLGLLWYFGTKTMRRNQLRMEAREAFAAEDWKKAEKLLNQYLDQDQDSEEDFVRLAYVYRHFGNTDAEMHCWYRASTLNPLKPEYWTTYTECAMNARNFAHLYTILARKLELNVELAPKDKILYLICSVMMDHAKDVWEFYEIMLEDDPEVFQQDDLARYAEFLVIYNSLTPEERSNYIEQNIHSDNPVVRLESLLLYLVELEFSGGDADFILEEEETMLKQVVDMNRFAVIPILSRVYLSHLKFDSVIEVAEPYLADIEHLPLSVLYAESCVYGGHPEKLKPLAEEFRSRGPKSRILASYFDALYEFSQGNNDDLFKHMQEVGDTVHTDLVNLINLQIALNNDSVEKICSFLETIMLNPPFYDLQERARPAVRHYLWTKIQEDPALADNPGRLARIAQLIAGEENTDPFLMRIIIADLYKRDLLTRQIIQENLNAFPVDPYLLRVAAEFELFNGNPEQSLMYIERFFILKEEKRSIAFDLLHAIALEQLGKLDEAAKEYAALVDNTEMDRGILYRYFRFCIDHGRRAELSAMADRLSASTVPGLKSLAPFFQAEELLLQDKIEEAFSVLETAETDQPDFALRAANLCSSFDLLDQALSRYFALLGKHPDKGLIFANIAEVYLAKGMKAEAISYAKQSWETNQDNGLAQFVYAKMLALDGRYQDAERVLKIPYREVELPDEIRDLWTDIMLHCVREDLANGHFSYALDRSNHYLILYPRDSTFHDLKARSEEELQKASLDFQLLMSGLIGARTENETQAPGNVEPEQDDGLPPDD